MKTSMRRALIVVAIVIFALGLTLSAKIFLMTWKAFGLVDKSFIRILVPGTHTIPLSTPSDYTIFFEHQSELGGIHYSAPDDALDGLTLSIENAETGKTIAVRAAGANSTYSIGSREGRAILAFRTDAPGVYRFSATLPEGGEDGRPYVLAIGKGLTKSVLLIISMIFGLVMVLIIAIVVPTVIIAILFASNTNKKAGVKGVDGHQPSG